MRYKVNKRYPIVYSIFAFFVCITATVLVFKYIHSISNKVFAISSFSSTLVVAIARLLPDLKASFTVTDDYFHYIRGGQNIKVRWEDIGRIEYFNKFKFIKALDCMVIYTGQGLLYIDYAIDDYLQLWQSIISRYQQSADEPNIDEHLILMLSKRSRGDGSES